MTWPRWLTRIFPRLLPRGTWGDAVRVTEPARLAALQAIYGQRVEWVRAVRGPEAVIAPDCRVIFRVWPKHLRVPDGFGWGKVLAPNVIPGDSYGTLLVLDSLKDNASLLAHECKHAITGVSDHPKWLFPNG